MRKGITELLYVIVIVIMVLAILFAFAKETIMNMLKLQGYYTDTSGGGQITSAAGQTSTQSCLSDCVSRHFNTGKCGSGTATPQGNCEEGYLPICTSPETCSIIGCSSGNCCCSMKTTQTSADVPQPPSCSSAGCEEGMKCINGDCV
jgi:hypothetical protein